MALITGSKIGVVKMMIGVPSRNRPSSSKKPIIHKMTSQGICKNGSNALTTRAGMFSLAIIQPNGAEAAIIKQMVPVVIIAPFKQAITFWIVSSLYTKNPRMMEIQTATMADSVAVKTPEIMPPIMAKGASRAKVAFAQALPISRNVALSDLA